MLRHEALQLNHVAQLRESFAEARLLDVANESQCESRSHIGRQRLHGLNQCCGLGGSIDRADVGDDDFAIRPRLCSGDAERSSLVASNPLGIRMELVVRLLRITGANFAARGLGDCYNGGCICHGTCFGIAGDPSSAFAATEADQVDGGRQPLVSEIDDDGQARELLPEFLYQENTGEWRHRDEDKVNVSLLDDAARSISKNRKPSHLRVRQQNVLQSSLEEIRLSGWGSRQP